MLPLTTYYVVVIVGVYVERISVESVVGFRLLVEASGVCMMRLDVTLKRLVWMELYEY